VCVVKVDKGTFSFTEYVVDKGMENYKKRELTELFSI
jgi:hypothetical protein